MSEIRFTLRFRQRWVYLLLPALFAALSVFEFAAGGSDGRYPLFLAPLFLLNFLLFSRFDTRVTPLGITWRRYGTRHLDWSEVAHVRERRLLGSRTIQLVLADGKVLNLAVPVDALFQRDREYDAKLATVWNAWAGATGRAPYLPGPDAPAHWRAQVPGEKSTPPGP
ncbi:hypothetical protein [Embleya sp. NPDC005575]|uniref:hypothetical protein n=1 Tax=Embleya sp. NPDC005575 TaxID=3156892 RepID=UPI0033AA4565